LRKRKETFMAYKDDIEEKVNSGELGLII